MSESGAGKLRDPHTTTYAPNPTTTDIDPEALLAGHQIARLVGVLHRPGGPDPALDHIYPVPAWGGEWSWSWVLHDDLSGLDDTGLRREARACSQRLKADRDFVWLRDRGEAILDELRVRGLIAA
jgi:hypothetical protein